MTEILLTLAASTILLTILAVIVQLVIIEPGFVHKVEFLIESKSFDEAETLIKAYLKKNNQDPTATLLAGTVKTQGECVWNEGMLRVCSRPGKPYLRS